MLALLTLSLLACLLNLLVLPPLPLRRQLMMADWTRRIIKKDRSEAPQVVDGAFFTSAPATLFRIINEQIKVARYVHMPSSPARTRPLTDELDQRYTTHTYRNASFPRVRCL